MYSLGIFGSCWVKIVLSWMSMRTDASTPSLEMTGKPRLPSTSCRVCRISRSNGVSDVASASAISSSRERLPTEAIVSPHTTRAVNCI